MIWSQDGWQKFWAQLAGIGKGEPVRAKQKAKEKALSPVGKKRNTNNPSVALDQNTLEVKRRRGEKKAGDEGEKNSFSDGGVADAVRQHRRAP